MKCIILWRTFILRNWSLRCDVLKILAMLDTSLNYNINFEKFPKIHIGQYSSFFRCTYSSDVFLKLFHKIQHVFVLVDYYVWKQKFVTLCFFASLISLIPMLHVLIFNNKIFIRKYFSIFVNFFRWLTTRSGEVNQIFYSLNIFRKKQNILKKNIVFRSPCFSFLLIPLLFTFLIFTFITSSFPDMNSIIQNKRGEFLKIFDSFYVKYLRLF